MGKCVHAEVEVRDVDSHGLLAHGRVPRGLVMVGKGGTIHLREMREDERSQERGD